MVYCLCETLEQAPDFRFCRLSPKLPNTPNLPTPPSRLPPKPTRRTVLTSCRKLCAFVNIFRLIWPGRLITI